MNHELEDSKQRINALSVEEQFALCQGLREIKGIDKLMAAVQGQQGEQPLISVSNVPQKTCESVNVEKPQNHLNHTQSAQDDEVQANSPLKLQGIEVNQNSNLVPNPNVNHVVPEPVAMIGELEKVKDKEWQKYVGRLTVKEMELFHLRKNQQNTTQRLKEANLRVIHLERELSTLKINDETVCQKWREAMLENESLQSKLKQIKRQHGSAKSIAVTNEQDVTVLRARLERNAKGFQILRHTMKRKQEQWNKERLSLQQQLSEMKDSADSKAPTNRRNDDFDRHKLMETLNAIERIVDSEHIPTNDVVREFMNVINPWIPSLKSESKQQGQQARDPTKEHMFLSLITHFATSLKQRPFVNLHGVIDVEATVSALSQLWERIDSIQKSNIHSVDCRFVLLLIEKLTGDIIKTAANEIYNAIPNEVKQCMLESVTMQNKLFEDIYAKQMISIMDKKRTNSLNESLYLETHRVVLQKVIHILKANSVRTSTTSSVLKLETRFLRQMVLKAREYGFDSQKIVEMKEYDRCKELIYNRVRTLKVLKGKDKKLNDKMLIVDIT